MTTLSDHELKALIRPLDQAKYTVDWAFHDLDWRVAIGLTSGGVRSAASGCTLW